MGAIGTRLSLRPPHFRRAKLTQTSDASRRENADAHPFVGSRRALSWRLPSPACGGGCQAKRGGWGLSPRIPLRREPPPPALPRKRERGAPCVGLRIDSPS